MFHMRARPHMLVTRSPLVQARCTEDQCFKRGNVALESESFQGEFGYSGHHMVYCRQNDVV